MLQITSIYCFQDDQQPIHIASSPRILDILINEYHCDPRAQVIINLVLLIVVMYAIIVNSDYLYN